MSRHPSLDTPSLSSHWFVLLQNSANGNLRLTDTDSPLSPGVLHGGESLLGNWTEEGWRGQTQRKGKGPRTSDSKYCPQI